MSEPPIPPTRPPPPPQAPLVPEYQRPAARRGARALLVFTAFFCGYFPLLFGVAVMFPNYNRAAWMSPLIAFATVGMVAAVLRSPVGFLATLAALVVGLSGCGCCNYMGNVY